MFLAADKTKNGARVSSFLMTPDKCLLEERGPVVGRTETPEKV